MSAPFLKTEPLNKLLSRQIESSLLKALLVFSVLGVTGNILFQISQLKEDLISIASGLESGLITDLQNKDRWTANSRLLSQLGADGVIELSLFDAYGERFASVQKSPSLLQSQFPILREIEFLISSNLKLDLVSQGNIKWGELQANFAPIRAVRNACLSILLILFQIGFVFWWLRRSLGIIVSGPTERLSHLASKLAETSVIGIFAGDSIAIEQLAPPLASQGSASEIVLVESAIQKFALEIQRTKSILQETEKNQAIALTTQQVTQNIIHDLKSPLHAFERVTTLKTWSDFEAEKSVFSNALYRIHSILNGLRMGEMEKIVRPHPSHFKVAPSVNTPKRGFHLSSTLS